MKPIIQIENLGKLYAVGRVDNRNNTLRESLVEAARRPFKQLRRLSGPRQPKHFNHADNQFWAIRDISFEVQQGEAVGIIGRNGAGKSTLLKLLSRITEPTTGQAKLFGRVGSLLEVGTGFHPELSGRENIYLNGAILGMRRREIARSFDEIVSFAQIDQFLDTPVKRYSSGMYMRLAFAVAAHMDTEILVVDEVLAVGDHVFQQKCIGRIRELGRMGRTILFVSHNIATIQRLCTRAILLEAGRLTASGSATEITKRYIGEAKKSALEWSREKPGSGSCYFENISVRDQHDRPLSVVPTAGCLRIRLAFVVKEHRPGLMLSVGLLDQFGEQIFGTTPADSGECPPETPGRHIYTVELPEDILMPTTYSIRAALWDSYHGIYDAVEEIRFEAMESASLANSTTGRRLGILAIRCVWRAQSGN